ncbi:hypothetical protein [Niabella ginsengisoli]|uniref:Tetratricopeptide repeat protein n=1 Tax=Niabella ginsengisoli TaxID=522298 RepID=A0ABS9SQS3_9BACT|nr:hypothetical protein [Niabella ginsengisoli]MCH5600714.1 hypothetical protein [Niabella ginsengisoli]
MDFQANLFIATIYDRLIYNKNDSAVIHYKNLTSIQPEKSKFWYLAGLALNSEKEYDSAFLYLQKAYELKPSSSNIVMAYASALQRKKIPLKLKKLLMLSCKKIPPALRLLIKKFR